MEASVADLTVTVIPSRSMAARLRPLAMEKNVPLVLAATAKKVVAHISMMVISQLRHIKVQALAALLQTSVRRAVSSSMVARLLLRVLLRQELAVAMRA